MLYIGLSDAFQPPTYDESILSVHSMKCYKQMYIEVNCILYIWIFKLILALNLKKYVDCLLFSKQIYC